MCSLHILRCHRSQREQRVLSTLQCQSDQPSLSSAQVSGNEAHGAHTSPVTLKFAGEPNKFGGEEQWALNDNTQQNNFY